MASNAKKASALPVSTGMAANDVLVGVVTLSSSPNSVIVSVASLFANSNVPFITVGNNALQTANLVITSPGYVPANSSGVGTKGMVLTDNNFIYVCIANNSWKRAALVTF